MVPPSGEQITIGDGLWEAVVVQVGGGLRALTHDGGPVLDGYGEWERAGGGRGQLLIPWPNRLAGGTYEWEGTGIRAPLSEPARGNAIHGLVRWSNWRATDWTEDRVTMRLRVEAQPAYPFALDLGVQYVINAGGLAVTLTATNVGDGPAPFGAGFHPYLTAGTALVDDAVLTVPAEAWMPADDAGIPTGERRPVDGDLDLRAGRAIGGSVLDHCFTGLDRDADGRAAVSLDGPAGRLRLWMDGAFGFVMVFTGDTLPPERRRRGVAVEPMSCAADAFNSGAGLVALHPGGQFVGSWGIAVDPAA